MSGGSYDYAYSKVQDMAHSLSRRETNPLRAAFSAHLLKVAEAMHAIEWVDSCDWGKGEDEPKIRECLAQGAELASAIKMAERAEETLRRAIEAAKGTK
jgi:hypothetical protein